MTTCDKDGEGQKIIKFVWRNLCMALYNTYLVFQLPEYFNIFMKIMFSLILIPVWNIPQGRNNHFFFFRIELFTSSLRLEIISESFLYKEPFHSDIGESQLLHGIHNMQTFEMLTWRIYPLWMMCSTTGIWQDSQLIACESRIIRTNLTGKYVDLFLCFGYWTWVHFSYFCLARKICARILLANGETCF